LSGSIADCIFRQWIAVPFSRRAAVVGADRLPPATRRQIAESQMVIRRWIADGMEHSGWLLAAGSGQSAPRPRGRGLAVLSQPRFIKKDKLVDNYKLYLVAS